MHRSTLKACLLSSLMVGVSAVALAQETVDYGKREYEINCAACHGAEGKGDGPYKEALFQAPPDLITISQRNGGVFPFQRIYEIIDGRGTEIKAHGPRDMPIWGAEYTARANESLEPYPEVFARTRILALIDYLYRIQAQ